MAQARGDELAALTDSDSACGGPASHSGNSPEKNCARHRQFSFLHAIRNLVSLFRGTVFRPRSSRMRIPALFRRTAPPNFR